MKKFFSISILLFFASATLLHAQKCEYYIPYFKKGLWGYSDTLGRIVITPKFTERPGFFQANGYARIFKGKSVGLINQYGKTVFSPKYAEITPFYEQYFRLNSDNHKQSLEGKNGYILIKEAEQIELFVFKSSKADSKTSKSAEIREMRVLVNNLDTVGLYSLQGNQLKLIKSFKGVLKMAVSGSGDLLGEWDQAFALVTGPNSNGISYTANGLVYNSKVAYEKQMEINEGQWGAASPSGTGGDGYMHHRNNINIKVNSNIPYIPAESDLLIRDRQKNLKPDNSVKEPNLENAYYYQINGKWGLVQNDSLILVPFEYDTLKLYSFRYSVVEGKIKEKHYLFSISDKNKPRLIADTFYTSSSFLMVCNENKWGVYRMNLDEVHPIMYEHILPTVQSFNAYFGLKKGGKYGLYSYQTKVSEYIYDTLYTDFFSLRRGVKVVRDSLLGYVDLGEKVNVIPCKYLTIGYLRMINQRFAYFEVTSKKGNQVFISSKGREYFLE